mmetsp:Transcript_12749/g.30128  ORF Transcript_12749/g.30128 Transcript_12749/m.30128 type:complete len:174 (-) Transcript_12749:601-1122(-)
MPHRASVVVAPAVSVVLLWMLEDAIPALAVRPIAAGFSLKPFENLLAVLLERVAVPAGVATFASAVYVGDAESLPVRGLATALAAVVALPAAAPRAAGPARGTAPAPTGASMGFSVATPPFSFPLFMLILTSTSPTAGCAAVLTTSVLLITTALASPSLAVILLAFALAVTAA